MENVNRHEGRDPALLAVARKRVSFKYHLITYLLVNSLFWLLWFSSPNRNIEHDRLPWPLYPMLGWGIGVCFQYAGAYLQVGSNLVEREYNKLIKQQSDHL